jgi:hypothetical protein
VRVGGDIIFLTDGASYSVTISTTGQTLNYSTDGVSGGGGGPTPTPTPTPAPPAVVVNEVAWMGSQSSSADEWIEL